MSDRIRWEPLAGGGAYGYVGTRATAVFKIWQYDEGGSAVQPWALKSDWLAGYATGTHPDDLKAEAERWLAEFVSSLGAVFPPAPASPPGRPVDVYEPSMTDECERRYHEKCPPDTTCDCSCHVDADDFPVIPAAQIQAEVAADVHRLTHPVETGQPWRSAAEADWDESR